jgi:hypothetical protein
MHLVPAGRGCQATSCGDDTATEAEFVIETDPAMPGEPTGFSATGAAVDEELLCPDGDAAWVQTLHADTGLPETPADPPRDGETLWVETLFTCSDGTGDFTLRAVAVVDEAELEESLETGEPIGPHPVSAVAGTGDYGELEVEGSREWVAVTPGVFEDGFSEVFSGTLTDG